MFIQHVFIFTEDEDELSEEVKDDHSMRVNELLQQDMKQVSQGSGIFKANGGYIIRGQKCFKICKK